MLDLPLVLAGNAPCLDWFAARLARTGGGMRLRAGQPLPDGALQVVVDHAGFAALLARDDWRGVQLIDVSGAWFETLIERDALVTAAGGTYLELAGPLMPGGIELGFSLATGGSALAYRQATPLLDRLAPYSGAHLQVGSAGAAGFCRLVATAVENLLLSAARDALTDAGTVPDWPSLFVQAGRRQRDMMAGLLHAAQIWRDRHPPRPDAPGLFADTLADWLVHRLPLGLEVDRGIAEWLNSLRNGLLKN